MAFLISTDYNTLNHNKVQKEKIRTKNCGCSIGIHIDKKCLLDLKPFNYSDENAEEPQLSDFIKSILSSRNCSYSREFSDEAEKIKIETFMTKLENDFDRAK